MKRIVFTLLLALGFLGWNGVSAQNNNNGNSNGNGNGPVVNNGLTNNQVVHILQAAHSVVGEQLGMSLGQMIQRYRDGYFSIEIIAPSSVAIKGGGSVIIVLESINL